MNSKIIKSRLAMQKFAAKFASPFRKGSTAKRGGISKATVIALTGELGAGKTTFTQGFLKALGVKHSVISPTFLIIRRYHLKPSTYNLHFTDAFHIDCYRIEKPEELVALSLKEIVKNPKHIVIIEWPEMVKKYLPKDTRWIKLHHGKGENERMVTLS